MTSEQQEPGVPVLRMRCCPGLSLDSREVIEAIEYICLSNDGRRGDCFAFRVCIWYVDKRRVPAHLAESVAST